MEGTQSDLLPWPEPRGWPSDSTHNRLIGDWFLYQRKGGHRTSTDDLVTAWYACHRTAYPVENYLDLGCGIGSVMLMVSHKLRPPRVWGIEAQPQSFAMATRSVGELPENACEFSLHHEDFRDIDFGNQRFDLVTASPPYFPIGTGVLPDDAQRRGCRFEARGGVEGYVEAAERALTHTGRMYVVFQTRWTDRVLQSAEVSKLYLSGRADFLMRSDHDQPFLSVYEFSRHTTADPHLVTLPVRNSEGQISRAYQAARDEMGL